MNDEVDAITENQNDLADAYQAYRCYAEHARQTKFKIRLSRWLLIGLGLMAAVFGLGCEIFRSPEIPTWLPQLLGSASVVCVVAAIIAAQIIQTKDWQSRWARSRSLAESIKSECFRCAVRSGRYRKNPELICDYVRQQIEKISDLKIATTDLAGNRQDFPFMTTEEYLQRRVRDQLHGFYRPRQRQFESDIWWAKSVVLVLAVIATIFGCLGVAGYGIFASAIGLCSAISGATGVLVFSARKPYLALSYGQTAAALQALLEHWETNRSTKAATDAETDELVNRCEEVISNENNEWRIVAELESS